MSKKTYITLAVVAVVVFIFVVVAVGVTGYNMVVSVLLG